MKKLLYALYLIPAFYTFQLLKHANDFIFDGNSIGEERGALLFFVWIVSMTIVPVVSLLSKDDI